MALFAGTFSNLEINSTGCGDVPGRCCLWISSGFSKDFVADVQSIFTERATAYTRTNLIWTGGGGGRKSQLLSVDSFDSAIYIHIVAKQSEESTDRREESEWLCGLYATVKSRTVPNLIWSYLWSWFECNSQANPA